MRRDIFNYLKFNENNNSYYNHKQIKKGRRGHKINSKMGMRSSSVIMFMYVLLIIALMLIVADADLQYDCSADLLPCYDSLDSDITPATACCQSMREATANQFICLCSLNSSDKSISWMNFTQARQLRHRCYLEDLSPGNCIGMYTTILDYIRLICQNI